MRPFPAAPDLSPYPDGVTWWLRKPFAYHGFSGTVVVPSKFESDFASVPTAVTNIFPRWGVYGPAAIIHDWLYWAQRCPRKTADDTFLEAMTALAVPAWKRQCLYRAVRYFGMFAWADNARLAMEGYSRIKSTHGPAGSPGWKRKLLASTLLPATRT